MDPIGLFGEGHRVLIALQCFHQVSYVVVTDRHETEVKFQQNKRRKKQVQANIHSLLTPSDTDATLQQETEQEIKRQADSYRSRQRARKKYADKTTASPPTTIELQNHTFYAEDDISMLAAENVEALARHGGTHTARLEDATIFVSSNPRNPTCDLITLAACLRGAWVVSPDVLIGRDGPCVKYLPAMNTKRYFWASTQFKTEFPRHWLVILAIYIACKKNWKMLTSAVEWASMKATCEQKHRNAEVIAMVGALEAGPAHCFIPSTLIDFIRNIDDERGTIGILKF